MSAIYRGTNHHNGLKTTALLGGMWGLLILIGYLLTRGTGSSIFLFIMPLIGVAQTAYTYWNSDKLAVRSMGAIEVTAAQEPVMHKVVAELSAASGQPMPRLFMAPTMSPNAFATGRNPANAAVCCTRGILQLLDERELRGVLGHELSHVYNRDVLTGSIAAGIAGVISSLGTMALWFGTGRDRRVANMPGAVPHTSTYALTNATLPYTLALADEGWHGAIAARPDLARGLSTHAGTLYTAGVGQALDLPAADVADLLG